MLFQFAHPTGPGKKLARKIVALQIAAESLDPSSILGQYIQVHLRAKAKFGYYPFHPRCWDVPTWAVNVIQRMRMPNFVLASPKLAVNIAHGADAIFGSVMTSNLDIWRHIILRSPHTIFVLGGYIPPAELNYPNVKWCNSIEEGYWALARLQEDPEPILYHPDLFLVRGTEINGARVQLSVGCLHHCEFCIVPHGSVLQKSFEDIYAEIRPLLGRKVGVVYVDDKTFGQSPNWKFLRNLNELIRPKGFVVQTTASQIVRMGSTVMREWREEMGIFAVEIGVESYNDPVLQRYRKPAREEIIDQAVAILADSGLLVCPNIIVGMAGETFHTYDRTANWMRKVPNLGWFNVYCLADYNLLGDDARENTPIKSWQTTEEQEVAMYGFKLLYSAATELMSRLYRHP